MLEELKLLINTMSSMSDEQRNIEINKMNDACEEIANMQSANPKIFLKSVYALLNILEKSIATSDPGETVLLYDIIKANISTCSHSYMKQKNQGAIVKFVQLVCYQISKIFNNPRQQFLNIDKNQEGIDLQQLQKSDPQSALALTYVDILNQVISNVSFTDLIPQFVLEFYPLATCGNEKIQAAFFICIGEFSNIQNIQQQSSLIQIIYNGINHKNPQVRYYSIYALSCFSKELDQQKFHKKYYHEFISHIILGLNQSTEQLACQWLQCFNSYIGKIGKKQQLSENVEHIMEKVCLFIQHSKGNKIKEYSLDCLVQLADIHQLFNIQKIQKCIDIFYAIIKSLPIETHKSVVHKAFKSLCKIIVILKYEKGVQKYIDFALNTIQNFNSKIQVQTLLCCWRLLCLTGVKFKNWTMFFQFIFQIIKGYCENNCYSERTSAYLTFKYTSICFEQKFGDYFIPTLQIILPCLKSAVQRQQIAEVEKICQTIDIVISNQRPKPNISENYYKENSHMMKLKTNRTNEIFPPEFLNIISELFQFYLDFLLKARDAEYNIKEYILFSFKLLIEHYGDIFSEKNIESLINSYWKIVQIYFSDKSYNNFVENQIFQSSEQEQLQQSGAVQSITSNPQLMLDDEEEGDEANHFNQCRIVLPLILGSIIQHMTEPKQVLNRALLEIQRQMNSYQDHYDLICVTRYIISIQQIPYQQISEHNPKIISFFKQHCTNTYPNLRTQISYAVCKMIINTPFTQDFQIKLDDWLEILNKCYNVPKNEFNDEEDFGACRENCVSILGHIIHKFGNHFNLTHLHDLWLDNLPLKYDKEQYKTQIDFLSNLVIFEPHNLISVSEVYQESQRINAITKVSRILKIFSEVKSHIEREPNIRENRDTLRKTKSAVTTILEWPIFKENSGQIQSLLPEEQSAHLSALLLREY